MLAVYVCLSMTSPSLVSLASSIDLAGRSCSRCWRTYLHHRARVVSEDAARRSLVFTIYHYLRVTGLNHLPLTSPASNARCAYAAATSGRGACTPSSVVCYDRRNAHLVFTTCHCLGLKSLYQIPRQQYVPTVRDAYTAAAGVRCTSTPYRNYRPYEHCGPTILFHKL